MSGSITSWLAAFRDGDQDAAQRLWNRYYTELVSVARARLKQAYRVVKDEEDIALSALDCFFSGIQAGRFPDICDRDGLWRLLVQIAGRKSIDAYRRQRRQKRSPGNGSDTNVAGPQDISEVVGNEPTPEFCAFAAEALNLLLGKLDGPLREIAIYRLQGYTTKEIAKLLGCSTATVERKLRRIRHLWADFSQGDE